MVKVSHAGRPSRSCSPNSAERNKLQRQAEKDEDEQNKLELQELTDNNMDAIYADFQRAPHDAMALDRKFTKQFDQPVPSIVKNIYSQALKNNKKQDEASDIELMAARGILIAVM